uniref:GTPase family protein n=1 Tax=Petrachloros mirabilis TaxID=2918835 RepID=UPI003084250C
MIEQTLRAAREDVPPWDNWGLFFQRCQSLVAAIARIYYPQAKRPLLTIYVPQAYRLMRDTVDDVDRWMQTLTPALGKVTIGQVYEAYETYQRLEPAARIALRVWNWSQWILNPAAAVARTATQTYSNQANQQLVVNLGQILRETTLKALGERAIALYSGGAPTPLSLPETPLPDTQTQSLRQIFDQIATPEAVAQAPLNVLLLGRTGAGKSSLINTLFRQLTAAVDVLPSTDICQRYTFALDSGETLYLWDTPGYEQADRQDFRQQVLEQALTAELALLVTPALDPALQADRDMLADLKAVAADLPIVVIVTQVDRLRPLREWSPPYDWQQGMRPKEQSIREAVAYRQEQFVTWCQAVVPLVTANTAENRQSWNLTQLSEALLASLDPAEQFRMARFLRDRESRIQTAAKIIDRYSFQMSTTQGLAALLKSPILSFIATLTTGSPALAALLATKLPIEQSPVVLGKLQMAYELFILLTDGDLLQFDLPALWPLLLESEPPLDQDAWAFGQTLVEYWLGTLTEDHLRERYYAYRRGQA